MCGFAAARRGGQTDNQDKMLRSHCHLIVFWYSVLNVNENMTFSTKHGHYKEA